MIKVIFSVLVLAAGSAIVFSTPESAKAVQQNCGLRCPPLTSGYGIICGCKRLGSEGPGSDTTTATAN